MRISRAAGLIEVSSSSPAATEIALPPSLPRTRVVSAVHNPRAVSREPVCAFGHGLPTVTCHLCEQRLRQAPLLAHSCMQGHGHPDEFLRVNQLRSSTGLLCACTAQHKVGGRDCLASREYELERKDLTPLPARAYEAWTLAAWPGPCYRDRRGRSRRPHPGDPAR